MKPNLFILLALLTVFDITSKAQSLSLDKTVNYINEILKTNKPVYCTGKFNRDYSMQIGEAKVDKSGRVSFMYASFQGSIGSFNVFDLESAEWVYEEEWSKEDAVLKLKTKNNVTLGIFLKGILQTDGDRLFKALMHLKDVCTKDPFGN